MTQTSTVTQMATTRAIEADAAQPHELGCFETYAELAVEAGTADTGEVTTDDSSKEVGHIINLRVLNSAASLPAGTVIYADGQIWTACAGHESTGLRWQQANGWGSGNDRYMDGLLADRWSDAGPSRVIHHGDPAKEAGQ